MKRLGMALGAALLLFGAASLSPPELSAAEGARGGERGDYLTVRLAVIGPGDELYFWWGHLGLIIDDALTGESLFYDWGVFSFDAENFFSNFAFGRLTYMTTVSRTERVLRRYVVANRDITLYTLDLDAGAKEEIRRFVEWNALPENRTYLYNHFSNNCVTRILALLDEATGGQIRERFASTPGRFTLREHVRRHTYFSPFADWILNFWMGQGIDGPATQWDEMFLPSEAGRNLQSFRYRDALGVERPLVSAVEVLNRARGRPAVLEAPRRQWLRALPVGLLLALLPLALYALRPRRERLSRVCLGLYQAALGLFFGAAGSLLFFMTFFTDHDYTWHNINVIFANPLLLAALPLGLIFAFSKHEERRRVSAVFLRALWTYVFLGALLSALIKLSPAYYQQNQVTLVLIMPLAFVLSFAPYRRLHAVLSRRGGEGRGAPPPRRERRVRG